jgi:NhaC family Na+:H+ antiporter
MGDEIATSLIATGGIKGMLPTITLVLSAMVFGGVMMGTGMIDRLTQSITAKLRSRKGTVVSTVFTGIFLNGCTGDQYLAIILNGNLYKGVYERNGLEGKLLSRTVEDSTSVTSVLIPWNSCGLAQSAVLGIATLHYLPYCIFNIASPIIAIIYALLYDKVKALFDKRRMFGMPAMLDNEE